MKIALFHNYYTQPGGEDCMFELEVSALRTAGHTVVTYTKHNSEEISDTLSSKIRTTLNTPYNRRSERDIRNFLAEHRPDISHVHNWFPLFSPSIYTAHQTLQIPVVQTLHNYRLGCAAANYQREGAICQSCTPGNSTPAIKHRCYKNSLIGSLTWKRLTDRNWNDGTFTEKVSHYICPSQEVMQQHLRMGLPEERMSHIPNACSVSEVSFNSTGPTLNSTRRNICFAGRFTPEKSAHILVQAWKQLPLELRSTTQLTMIGSGPQEAYLHQLAGDDPSIHFTGQLTHQKTLSTIRQAELLVCPSLWAEPFGLSIIEAMGAGLPVIGTALGGPAEIITHETDGYLLPAGDISKLQKVLTSCLKVPGRLKGMGSAARQTYLTRYTPEAHAEKLIQCFTKLL
jgi:glycosyltransferase involved in cell wall biosynthesis